MRVLSILSLLMVISLTAFSKSNEYYLKKLEEKCKVLEHIPKPIVLREKYKLLCDKARYCYKKFGLVVCDEDFYARGFACPVGSIACIDFAVAWPSWDKYGLGNCACNEVWRKLNIIDSEFTFR